MNSANMTETVNEYGSKLCPFCEQYNGEAVFVGPWKKRPISHLVITLHEDGSTHIHGPIEDPKMMNTLLDAALIQLHKNSKDKDAA